MNLIEKYIYINTDLAGLASVKPYPAKLIYLNLQALEIVSLYRHPQLKCLKITHIFYLI